MIQQAALPATFVLRITMAFEPDIIVTVPDTPFMELVIEAKTHLADLHEAETDLKQYMLGMRCPLGILVTPDHLWLYRDFYTKTPDSVRRIGDYDLTKVWREPPPTRPNQFEAFVQHWLEDLAKAPPSALPRELDDTLRDHLIPALASGVIRAAHPR
jgi:hypothetical protein